MYNHTYKKHERRPDANHLTYCGMIMTPGKEHLLVQAGEETNCDNCRIAKEKRNGV